MPYDASYSDTLTDIDRAEPLSIKSSKRIVRAAQCRGLLAMDHPHAPDVARRDVSPFMSPRGVIDATNQIGRDTLTRP